MCSLRVTFSLSCCCHFRFSTMSCSCRTIVCCTSSSCILQLFAPPWLILPPWVSSSFWFLSWRKRFKGVGNCSFCNTDGNFLASLLHGSLADRYFGLCYFYTGVAVPVLLDAPVALLCFVNFPFHFYPPLVPFFQDIFLQGHHRVPFVTGMLFYFHFSLLLNQRLASCCPTWPTGEGLSWKM